MTNAELQSPKPLCTPLSSTGNLGTPGGELCEDVWSGIFHDYDEERCQLGLGDADEVSESLEEHSVEGADEILQHKALCQQEEGLENYSYDIPFMEVDFFADGVDIMLEERFITEANTIIDNVLSESNGHGNFGDPEALRTDGIGEQPQHVSSLTRLSALRTFVPDCLLGKLKAGAKRARH